MLKETDKSIQFTDIEQGIKESVKWFISNYEVCRK